MLYFYIFSIIIEIILLCSMISNTNDLKKIQAQPNDQKVVQIGYLISFTILITIINNIVQILYHLVMIK